MTGLTVLEHRAETLAKLQYSCLTCRDRPCSTFILSLHLSPTLEESADRPPLEHFEGNVYTDGNKATLTKLKVNLPTNAMNIIHGIFCGISAQERTWAIQQCTSFTKKLLHAHAFEDAGNLQCVIKT